MTATKTLRTVSATTAALLLGIFGPSSASALSVVPVGDPNGFAAEVSTTQAGAHPDGVTSFNTQPQPTFQEVFLLGPPLKDNVVDLPPGVIGNPQAVPARCTEAQLAGSEDFGGILECPDESQVGQVQIRRSFGFGYEHVISAALYVMQASEDELAVLGFRVDAATTHVTASVRPEDNGLRLAVENIAGLTLLPPAGATVTVWGVPGDPSHDTRRCHLPNYLNNDLCDGEALGGGEPDDKLPHSFDSPVRPFFTNPTACDGPKQTSIRVSSWWDAPNAELSAPVTDTDPTPTGCNQLEFNPTIEANPTTNVADSPSGLDFALHVPQNEDPDGLATSHLKDVVVTLPAGLTVNPSSANGLGACSPSEIGLGVDVPNACPDASKLGTVQIDTLVLENPVPGAIYLASQNDNPFNSLLALYIAAKLPNGQEVKLPGKVEADSTSGQLKATFKNNPQLPFEDLHVSFFGGAGASLRTPVACGTFTTNSALTPWASPDIPDAFPVDSFSITQGAGGGSCVSSDDKAPHQPSFSAGTVDPTAGAFTPFVLKLARQDGSQPIKAIDTALPKGLLAKLAGTPYCPDSALASAAGKSGKSEQSSSSCPSASEVGTVNVAAGAGPAPLNVGGKAYLAGPYKGAPLSLAVVTPAVAGPFDLGTVVVRAALNIDPATAQAHAVSDEIPTILQGIPLDVRSISLDLAKPQFTLNPTSCDPMQITGSALSAFGQSASLSQRFQVGDCGRLAFKPKLAIRLKGGAKRDDNPALTATLTYPKGPYANIASASVALPRSEFLDQSHIRTVCTRVQYAADQCPPGSVYGFARAVTPLLDKPLEGPVYLRSSSNPLPDLVAALKGQVDFDLAGRIDSVKGGGIRTTFEGVPDAPVSKFTLMMKGGKKGLLVNSRDICKRGYKATASFVGQNGKAFESQPALKNGSCNKKGRKGKGRNKGGGQGKGKRG